MTLLHPVDLGPPASSVCGVLQVRMLGNCEEWSGLPFPSPGDLPNPGVELASPAWPLGSLPCATREAPITYQGNEVKARERHHTPVTAGKQDPKAHSWGVGGEAGPRAGGRRAWRHRPPGPPTPLLGVHPRTRTRTFTAAEFTVTPNWKPRHPSKPLGQPHWGVPLGNQRPDTGKGTRVQGSTHTRMHTYAHGVGGKLEAVERRGPAPHLPTCVPPTGGRQRVQGKEGSRGTPRFGLAVLTCARRRRESEFRQKRRQSLNYTAGMFF